jgi:hypothetical protein
MDRHKSKWIKEAQKWCDEMVGQTVYVDGNMKEIKVESWKITDTFHHHDLELWLNGTYEIWLSSFPLPKRAIQNPMTGKEHYIWTKKE